MGNKKSSQTENLLFQPEFVKGIENSITGIDICISKYLNFFSVSEWKREFSKILLNAGWKSKRCKLRWEIKRANKIIFFKIIVTTLKNEKNGSAGYYDLLPTPTAVEIGNEKKVLQNLENGLSLKSRKAGNNIQYNLTNFGYMGILPTPKTTDYITAEYPDKYNLRKQYQLTKGVNLEYPLRQFAMDVNPTGKTNQLSPFFVEEIMGFPPGWTELPFQPK